jgi:hypothetical protein
MSGTALRAVMRGTGYRSTLSSGTWEGAFGVDATTKYVDSKYVLYAANGSVAHFHDFSESYKPGTPECPGSAGTGETAVCLGLTIGTRTGSIVDRPRRV